MELIRPSRQREHCNEPEWGSSLHQQFDPWGKVRSGGITQTKINYTGQRRDDTGLLYYHARYYDPSLARFVSPDSIVPRTSDALTTDFHEYGQTESHRRASREQSEFAPHSAQKLNRYTYVGNNPLLYKDPSGHCRTADGDSRPYAQGPGCADGRSSGDNAGKRPPQVGDPGCGMIVANQCLPGQYTEGNDAYGNSGVGGGKQRVPGVYRYKIKPGQEGHIFGKKKGHLEADTPANRELLEAAADNPNNYLGTDTNGTDWYAYTRDDGTQVWVEVRGGEITNGGVNEKPRSWDAKKRRLIP